jgi:HAD superfamily hydrolase (TIGR01509 family)
VSELFGTHLSAEEALAHGAAKEELYRSMAEPNLLGALVPGVREMLVRHAGMPVGLATNAEPANVDFLLDRAKLRKYFQVVIDGHHVQHPKPHPEIYLRAAQLLGVSPQDCVVFEDSFSGVQAARAAGARIVGLTTTHRELPGADLAVDDFCSHELESWMKVQIPRG